MKTKARLAELALVATAAVWGATFVMVQDAVRSFPVMAFLAYRFVPAAAVLAPVFRRELRALPAAGWRAGLGMGAFLTAGYVLLTFGLLHTTVSNTGFITGLFVVLTPVFGALLYRQRAGRSAWIAAAVSAAGLFLLSGAGGRVNAAGDGLVLLCACAFALQILATGRAVERHDPGALVVVQLALCGLLCLVAAAMLDLRAAFRRRMDRAGRHLARGERPGLPRPDLRPAVDLALPHRAGARERARLRGALRLAAEGETLSAVGWAGAALIMASIVGVEVAAARRPRDEGA